MGREGQSAKKDAPSERTYRELKRAAQDGVSPEKRLECEFILRMMGELGLRSGEVVHLSENWVDFERLVIRIPEHDPCTSGKNETPCGYCRQQARQIGNDGGDRDYEKALLDRWEPKNADSSRNVWYGWNKELVDLVDEFFIEHDEFPLSRVSVNRRVKSIAKEARTVDESAIYPHALRGHAARFQARKGMRAFQLKKFMGWSDIGGAIDYIKMESEDVQSELRRVHNVS